jgi:hypothetical protein
MPSYHRRTPVDATAADGTRFGGGGVASKPSSPVRASVSSRPAELRAPITITCWWLGGRAEPWIGVRCGEWNVTLPGTLTVWELILRTKGWEPLS